MRGKNYTQLHILLYPLMLLYATIFCEDPSSVKEDCPPGESWEYGQCVPDIDSGLSDTSYGPDPSECNYFDEPHCWSCYQNEIGIYCLQIDPYRPTASDDWFCYDTATSRVCQRNGDQPVDNPEWTCVYADDLMVCTRNDPDYPDNNHDWTCYDDEAGRHCYDEFCDYGTIVGYICNPNTELTEPNAVISIETPTCNLEADRIEVMCDNAGNFEMDPVPTGTYTVYFNGESTGVEVTVPKDESVKYVDNQCQRYRCRFGSLEGQLCNDADKHWVSNGTVALTVPPGCGSTTGYDLSKDTDATGYVRFDDLPEGDYSLTITEGDRTWTETLHVDPDQTNQIPIHGECSCKYGRIAGYGCYDSTFMAGGTVKIDVSAGCGEPARELNGAIIPDGADQGKFSIEEVPEGTYTVAFYHSNGTYVGNATEPAVVSESGTASVYGPEICACNDCTDLQIATFTPNQLTCHQIWVSNALDPTNPQTVHRIDVDNPTDIVKFPTFGDDPSRTAVDKNCNVWVTNRGDVGSDPDKFNAVLLNGSCTPEPECLTSATYRRTHNCCAMCKIRIGNNIGKFRGVAIDSDNNAWMGRSGEATSSTTTVNRYVYKVTSNSSGCTHSQMFETPDIGSVVYESGSYQSKHNYGFAIYNDILWISHMVKGVSRYDITTGPTSLKTLQRTGSENNLCPYGIAMDSDGNPWFGNIAWESPCTKAICRVRFEGTSFLTPDCYGSGNSYINNNGVIVDKERNIVWAVGTNNYNGSTVINKLAGYWANSDGGHPIGSLVSGSFLESKGGRGVTLDYHGNLWTVATNGNIHRLVYQSGGYDASQELSLTAGTKTYVYSDFSGYGLFNYTINSFDVLTFNAGSSGTSYLWKRIDWTGIISGVQARFRFRSSADNPSLLLPDEGWSEYTSYYGINSTMDLTPYILVDQYLQVEVSVIYSGGSTSDVTIDVTATWDKEI